MDIISPWMFVCFLSLWYVLLILFDGFMHVDENTCGMAVTSAATRKINFWSSLFNHGASYIHCQKYTKCEINYTNLKEDIGYTFSLESRLLDNNTQSEWVSRHRPDCVLNAYGVLCYQKLYDN